MMDYTGKTALITGASSGIGEAFARALAARGANLVLVARSEEKLRALSDSLAREHDISTDVIVADLAQENAASTVCATTERMGRSVDVLVNNAGFGTYGQFAANEATREHKEVMLNVASVIDLTHCYVPGMLERKFGAVINVSSTAAYQPVPYMAVYGASKAFVLSFSEALWEELRKTGVRVLALCPGATNTEFFREAGEGAAFGAKDTPENVVRIALEALDSGRPVVVPGAQNAFVSKLPRFLPRGTMAGLAARAMRPRQAS